MAVLDIFTPAPKRTPEETQQILQAIKDYNNAMDDLNVQIKTAVGNNGLLPDTATYLYNLIIGGQKWLKDNPRSDLSAIQINLSSVQQQFKSIMDTEGYRFMSILGILFGANGILGLTKSKLITAAQEKEFKNVLTTYLTWYKANQYTATPSEFGKQFDSNQKDVQLFIQNDPNLKENLTNINLAFFKEQEGKLSFNNIFNIKRSELVALTADALNKLGLTSPSQTPAEAKNQINLQMTAAAAATPASAPAVITSTASQAFNILFLILLVLLGGSFAANLAIGRTIPYRILYFLYGCIPFFSPFVILYVIYLRIRYGPVPLYGIFPLSTESATTRLGKLLWYPFYWIPDTTSDELKVLFEKSLIV